MKIKVTATIKLIRVKQWVKNLFVFAPLVFSLQLFGVTPLIETIAVFFAFSLVASSIYALNDIVDAERDRYHPKKKDRPLPLGLLSLPEAALIGLLCLGGGFLLGIWLNLSVVAILAVYVVMNLFY